MSNFVHMHYTYRFNGVQNHFSLQKLLVYHGSNSASHKIPAMWYHPVHWPSSPWDVGWRLRLRVMLKWIISCPFTLRQFAHITKLKFWQFGTEMSTMLFCVRLTWTPPISIDPTTSLPSKKALQPSKSTLMLLHEPLLFWALTPIWSITLPVLGAFIESKRALTEVHWSEMRLKIWLVEPCTSKHREVPSGWKGTVNSGPPIMVSVALMIYAVEKEDVGHVHVP